jgi:hypothetical protein
MRFHAMDDYSWLKLERSEENLGFGPAFNRAASRSRGKILVLLSNDVKILGNFIRPLPDLVGRVGLKYTVICHQQIDYGAGWNVFGAEKITYPAGYFLAMEREAWKRLGGFDERFVPHDYEDVDLGMKIMKDANIDLKAASFLPLQHMVAQTIGFNSERYENTVKMRALFAEKWGLINDPERPGSE